jgi:hypothetical protein
MTEPTQSNILQIWTPKIMLHLLNRGVSAERRQIRDKVVKNIDRRGLNLTDAATLETFANSEVIKVQVQNLLTPRPGERSNLDKILDLLEVLVRSNKEILDGQSQLAERLAEVELQISALNACSPRPLWHEKSNDSQC